MQGGTACEALGNQKGGDSASSAALDLERLRQLSLRAQALRTGGRRQEVHPQTMAENQSPTKPDTWKHLYPLLKERKLVDCMCLGKKTLLYCAEFAFRVAVIRHTADKFSWIV